MQRLKRHRRQEQYFFKDMENVLPLFADQAGLGGIGLCFSNEAGFCIKTGNDISGEWLLEKLADVAETTDYIFDVSSERI